MWQGVRRSVGQLLDRDQDGVTELAVHGLRQEPLAVHVLDQDHLAGADNLRLAVAGRDLVRTIEVDDVLSAGRRMPIEAPCARRVAEDDTRGGKPLSGGAVRSFLGPFYFDVAEMALALFIGIEIVDAHP